MVAHNRRGKNSIYINLIQPLFRALGGEWRDPAEAFKYEPGVWLEGRKTGYKKVCVCFAVGQWRLSSEEQGPDRGCLRRPGQG